MNTNYLELNAEEPDITTSGGSNRERRTELKPKTDTTEYTIEDLLEESKGKTISNQTGSEASTQDIESIVTEILHEKNLNDTQKNRRQIEASIALLAQEGATSPKFADTRTCETFGIKLSVKEIRTHVKSKGLTIRKVARALSNECIKIAQAYNIEGNLSKSYKLEYPNATIQDLILVSDFQTFNPDTKMPEHVRDWLIKNYKRRFQKNQ